MKNKLSKHEKKVRNNVYGSLALMLILLFTAIGIAFYILTTDIQLSRQTKNSLFIAMIVSLLGTLLVTKFWANPALMEYIEEFRNSKQLQKDAKVISGRTLMIGLCLAVFIILVIFFWYFRHHLPTEKIRDAEGKTVRQDKRINNKGQRFWDEVQQAALEAALSESPADGSLWTGPKGAAWVSETLRFPVSDVSGWNYLKRLGRAVTCRFSVDLQNGKTIRIALI